MIEMTKSTHRIGNCDKCIADLDANGNPLRTYLWGSGIDNLLAMTVFLPDSTNTIIYDLKNPNFTDVASVGAGWDVANGDNYDTTVSNLVDYIWAHEKESDKSKKLWPNPNAPDNYKGSSSIFIGFNLHYGSPGFLFMSK